MKTTLPSTARRVARWAAALCLAAGAIFAFFPPVTSQAASYGTPYYSDIINAKSNLCLSVPGASKATAVDLNQYYCGNGDGTDYPDQDWTLYLNNGGSTFVIVNDNSGLCMSVPGASTAATTDVNQYPCGLYQDQYWGLTEVYDSHIGGYAWEIQNEHSGLCLSVPGASTAATAHVNQYPCGLYPDQYWEIGGLDATTT